MGRLYSHDDRPNVPAWRIVEFPTGQTFVYDDLEHANNARIIARAFANLRKEKRIVFKLPDGREKVREFGWSAFARHLNYMTVKKITRKGDPRRGSLSSALSNKIYGNVCRGTLPKDTRVVTMLFELSGYPWD